MSDIGYFYEYQASIPATLKVSEVLGTANKFYTVIMVAMRCADTDNLAKLKAAFPDVYEALVARYEAPSGCLTDTERLRWSIMHKYG